MSKRFTDTDKWFDEWFRTLAVDYKLFWIYLCDRCNNAGVWKVDLELANFVMGTNITLEKATELYSDRIAVLRPGYWLMRTFVPFQFGDLSPANRYHASVLGLLKKEGAYKALKRPLQRASKHKQGHIQEQGAVVVGVGDGMEGAPKRFVKPTVEEVTAYAGTLGFKLDAQHFLDYYEARGWKYKGNLPVKDWKATVRTWKKNEAGGVGYGTGTRASGGYVGAPPIANKYADRANKPKPAAEAE